MRIACGVIHLLSWFGQTSAIAGDSRCVSLAKECMVDVEVVLFLDSLSADQQTVRSKKMMSSGISVRVLPTIVYKLLRLFRP